jgi:predicted amidophosphoribosyltransferase
MSPVSRIVESYRNVLVAVPAAGADVCRTCWRDTRGPQRCRACQEHLADRPDLLADVVVPIALAEKQLAHELRQYKDGGEAVRRQQQLRLAAVLAEFLRRHEKCLVEAVKVPGFDLVTTVPSTKGRQSHPLAKMLGESILQVRPRFTEALQPVAGVPADRALRPDRFTPAAEVSGLNVLVVDDVWTTGARMQSACATLKLAGAAKVGGLVIGRWFDSTYAPSRAYITRARSEPFDWQRCCLGRSGFSSCCVPS